MNGELRDQTAAPGEAGPLDLALASPEALLAAYAGGRDEAFTALVERIGGRLFGFLCRLLADRHAAEDVYQAVLVKIARHAGEFDGRARVVTWVYRIARNAAIDEMRRRPKVRLTPLEERGDEEGTGAVLDRMDSGVESPDAPTSREELRAAIREAVDRLPEEQREVFLLKEEGDLTFEEIGELLGCGKETAKSRMRYAVQKLQNSLQAEARHYGLDG